ncbi:MAG: 3'(2'),5'-bisphosphate nucleotidase CysQ [Alphaproteobacteria bacterium]
MDQDYELLITTVREAGALAMTYFRRDIDATNKSDGSPVSEADLAVDRYLREQLTGNGSPHGWLSEETADDLNRLDMRSLWVVDPIDGTRAFLEGSEQWVVSAALVVDEAPVLAAIYNPVTEELFTARHGMGAFLNNERVAVEDVATVEDAHIMGSRGMFKKSIWAKPWPEFRRSFVRSIAYRISAVVCGKVNAALSITALAEWDIAAATLLMREAGGVITTLDDTPLTFNKEEVRSHGIVAAGPKLHARLIDYTKVSTSAS